MRPQDGGPRQDDDPEEPQEPDQPREFVMVLDADSPTGEQVVLQLILARQQIKAVVSDAAAAAAGFGPYITPVQVGCCCRLFTVASRNQAAAAVPASCLPCLRRVGGQRVLMWAGVWVVLASSLWG